MGGIPKPEAVAVMAEAATAPPAAMKPRALRIATPIEECLHWNRFDMPCLDLALEMTPGRKVAVQAGGNLGMFAAKLSETFEAVYTFEPDAVLFPMLVANAPRENVIRFQAALGDGPHFVGTKRETPDNTHLGVTHIAGPGIIPTVCLDDLGLRACDLLYLDVEGYELYALRGAAQTIARCKPVIVVEVNRCCLRYGYTESDIAVFLRNAGYEHNGKLHNDHYWTAL
jgi:FkbM family methyltransferase